jgi:hypothetical protein
VKRPVNVGDGKMRYDFDRVVERKARQYQVAKYMAARSFPVGGGHGLRLPRAGRQGPARTGGPPGLWILRGDGGVREIVRERLKRLYGWDVPGEEIILVPGVVTGLNLAFTLFAEPGEAVLVQTPSIRTSSPTR